MFRIKFQEIFRMNVGLPDLSKKSFFFFLRLFFLKYGFSQTTFFRKVRETNIHSKNFLKFDSAHFVIQIDRSKKNF